MLWRLSFLKRFNCFIGFFVVLLTVSMISIPVPVTAEEQSLPEDIEELLGRPIPGSNIIDLGDKGLEPGDEIDSLLREWVQDDNQVRIPEGTYRLSSEITFQDIGNASIIGEGEVIFDRGYDHKARILLFPDGDFKISNIELKGKGASQHGGGIVTGTRNPDATILIKNVQNLDGAKVGTASGMFVSRWHAGKLYLVDVSLAGFPDNGLYGSAPGLEGDGEVHVFGGVYMNNNITNIRIGSHNSSIRNAVSIHNDYGPIESRAQARNQRGIWVWPADNILIENVDMIQTVGWIPIVIGGGEGSGIIRDVRIQTESDRPAVSIGSDQNWKGSNIHLTGGGNYSITGAEFTDIYTDEDAELPSEEAFELRPETLERKAAILLADGFNADEYQKVTEYLSIKGALVEEFGTEEGRVISSDGEVSTDIEKLTDFEIDDYHLLFIPGGTSYEVLSADQGILDGISEFYSAGKLTSAVSEGIDVLKEAGIETSEEGLAFDENLLNALDAEYIDELNLKFAELIGVSTRKVLVGETELELTSGYIKPGKLNIFFETEDTEALTFREALIDQALKRAKEEYDPDEHRGYSAYIDPEIRQIMDGEWEEAGFKTVWEAAEQLIYSFALTGPHAPDRDPEALYNLFRNSPVYRDLSGEERDQLSRRYYEDEEDKTFLLYSSDLDKEVDEFKSVEVIIDHERGARWINAAQLDIEPGVDYRAAVMREGEMGEVFTLTPTFEPEAFEVSFSNSSWRLINSLSLRFGFGAQ